MLSKKLRIYFTKKRSSPSVFWKGIFLLRDRAEKFRSDFLDVLVMLKKPEKISIKEVSQKSLKNNIGKFHFFGEFGFFHFSVIGGLSQYFKIHPEHKIEIVTYENYGKMLELAFPENVKAYYTDYKFDEVYRSCYRYWNRVFRMSIKKLGFKKNVAEDLILITPGLPKIRLGDSGGFFFQMTHPLKYPLGKKKEKFISIFPRFRKAVTEGNIREDTWDKVIKLLSKYGYKTVVQAHGAESRNLKHKNLIYPKNIYEQIAYLNNSDLAITPFSGTQHFAQNCGCDIFVIISSSPHQVFLFGRHEKNYRPFGTKIYSTRENEDYVSDLEKVLKDLKNKSK
jgi:hypothetical protein